MDGRIDGTNNVDPHQQHRCTPYTRELGCNRQPIKKKDFNSQESDEEDESKKRKPAMKFGSMSLAHRRTPDLLTLAKQSTRTYVRTHSNQNCPSGSVQISIARKE